MIYSDDVVMQRMSCINSTEGDVVVLISHTGRTKTRLKSPVSPVKMTLPCSPSPPRTRRSRRKPLTIILNVPEDTDIYMPMISRLAQLTIIDVLATGFTLRRGPKFRDNLRRVKEALKDSRIDKLR